MVILSFVEIIIRNTHERCVDRQDVQQCQMLQGGGCTILTSRDNTSIIKFNTFALPKKYHNAMISKNDDVNTKMQCNFKDFNVMESVTKT